MPAASWQHFWLSGTGWGGTASDTTRAIRVTGIDPRRAEVTWAQFAVPESSGTDTNRTQAVRVTGRLDSDTNRAVRVTGRADSAQAYAVRVTGQASLAQGYAARVTGKAD